MSNHKKIADKTLAQWVRVAREAGWTVRMTNGGHLCWRSPSGMVVHTASTPHGGERTHQNMRSLLRRAGLKI